MSSPNIEYFYDHSFFISRMLYSITYNLIFKSPAFNKIKMINSGKHLNLSTFNYTFQVSILEPMIISALLRLMITIYSVVFSL